jgi:flavin reductase (DIM6/NTAB) family NADH-FMN oxidoreductase RutF
MKITSADLENLEKSYRTNLINSLSGFKGVFVIGTSDGNQSNLAIFNSVMHIGANPGLMGFVQRPASVERHTYENIKKTGVFTLNAVAKSWIEKAHQTAARYPQDLSEFDAVGLGEFFIDSFDAPFVANSKLNIGLKFVEEVEIKSNSTLLIIGQIEYLQLDENAIANDGFLDHVQLETAASVGLDAYYSAEKLFRLSYAKPDKSPQKL